MNDSSVTARLLPRNADNSFPGHKAALWLFGAVITVRALQSVITLTNGGTSVQAIDGMPLDTYPQAAAQNIVSLYALYALSRLMLSLISFIVIFRYRSLVAMMSAITLFNYLAVQVVVLFFPLIKPGVANASIVNRVLIALTALALVLSLVRPAARARAASASAA